MSHSSVPAEPVAERGARERVPASGAAAWPLGVRAQQPANLPTVYGSIMGTLQDMKDMTALIAGAGIARTNSAANSERRSLRLSAPQ